MDSHTFYTGLLLVAPRAKIPRMRFIGPVADITERKRAEEMLNDLETGFAYMNRVSMIEAQTARHGVGRHDTPTTKSVRAIHRRATLTGGVHRTVAPYSS